ncbi:hypothetical protein [Kineococcus gypseus]|uniref:hypothetical protein n=1 Tax=Kineococcus gypseus TaxID=1637102 RepID=UPI003D7D9B32
MAGRGEDEDRQGVGADPDGHSEEDAAGDAAGDDDEGGGAAGWLLVVVAAAPVLAAAESCRRFLGGARDRERFGLRGGEVLGGEDGLALTDRWSTMLSVVPVGTALLASVLGLLLLTGLALAGRPARLVPGRAQRWAGAGTGALVALVAAGLVAGSLATVARPQEERDLPFFVLDTWSWLEAAVPVSTALLAAVAALTCAVVLVRPGQRTTPTSPAASPSPAGAGTAARAATAQPGPPRGGGANGTANGHANGTANGHANGTVNGHANGTVDGAVDGAVDGGTDGTANGAHRAPAPPAVPDGPPRLRAEDRALYRRP